jgi:hypothetical protein
MRIAFTQTVRPQTTFEPMKLPLILCLLLIQLLAVHNSQAQTVLQGDSCYLGFQPHKDSLASIVAQLGQHYHKTELRTWYHALLRGGGELSGTRLAGYALHYQKLGATFCVDDKTGHLFRIQLDRNASTVSNQGIRPGAATFAMVIERYGPSQRGKEREGQPRVHEFTFDHKNWFAALQYPHISFISRGKPKTGENLLARKVQEIWLR